MTDFVGMMDALVAMGVDPRNVTILDKGYPYTKRHRVDGYLRDKLGLRVFTYRSDQPVSRIIWRWPRAGT